MLCFSFIIILSNGTQFDLLKTSDVNFDHLILEVSVMLFHLPSPCVDNNYIMGWHWELY